MSSPSLEVLGPSLRQGDRVRLNASGRSQRRYTDPDRVGTIKRLASRDQCVVRWDGLSSNTYVSVHHLEPVAARHQKKRLLSNASPIERVLRFLGDDRPMMYCDPCLAGALALDVEVLRDAMWGLVGTTAVGRGRGECSACRDAQLVTWAA